MRDKCPRSKGGCGKIDYEPLPRGEDGKYRARCLARRADGRVCGMVYVRTFKPAEGLPEQTARGTI
jgi:hypothetical protein